MKKLRRDSQLSILSVMLILTTLLLAILGITNSWFTSGENKKIELVINIGQINIAVYQQKPDGSEVLINTFEENETSPQPSYVDLTDNTGSREIVPDQNYSLNLILKNTDVGDQSLYIRYKIELYACNNDEDILLHPSISGFTAPTASSNGFVYDETDGYYYYRNGAGVNQPYDSNQSNSIIGAFSIPYSDFAFTGDYPTINGNNLKLVLSVEGFDVNPQV